MLVAVSAPPGAKEPSAGELLAELQRWLDGTHDLRARFEQVLVSGALGSGIEESGRLWLERPGRMRWDYDEPEAKVALIVGDRTRLYVAEDRQMWEGSLSDADTLLPVLLTGGRPLSEAFVSELEQAPATAESPRTWRLRLVPRQEAEALQEVVIVIRDPARVRVEEVEVLDSAGNRLLYRFTDLERNGGLPAGTFAFEPPPGTEIIAE